MIDHSKSKNDPTLRVCDVCKKRKPREFGQYVPNPDKMTQKWHCLSCYDLRNRR